MKNEIRKDYFLNKYVIFTPERIKRPKEERTAQVKIYQKKCGFCPTGIEKDLIIKGYPNNKKWQVMVLKNKYPVVTPDNPKSYGKHEVVIETPQHNQELSQLTLPELIQVLRVYQDRTREISKIKNINYILIFKNEGDKAGASLTHAHSQIFASQILPPDVQEELMAAHQYEKKHSICPYCQIVKKEEKSPRQIWSDKNFVAFCPYASAYHYEAWIFSRRHLDNVTNLNQPEIKSLAQALKFILSKLYRFNLSYNFFLHQVISNSNQHFYLKIQPRESVWGGIELGSGIIINSITPEMAAKFYRD